MRRAAGSGAFLALVLASASAAGLDHEWFPVARVAMGAAPHVSEPSGLGYALELTAGATRMPEFALFGEVSGTVFNAEAGYLFDGFGDDLHAFHATLGLGYGAFLIGGLYQPRLILGMAGDGAAVGIRNGMRGYWLADMVSLELAHQFVHHHDRGHHDIHVLIAMNFLSLTELR
jgi:hypothetical protein